MKRVLIVLPTDSLGGAENYLKMIAIHFKNEDVEVYSFKNEERGLWDDIKSHAKLRFLTRSFLILGLLKFVGIMLFKRTKYDYIFTSQVYVNGLIGMLRSMGIIKAKYFIARESTSVYLRFSGKKLRSYNTIIRFGYRKMDLLICQTEEMKQQFIDHFSKIIKRTEICVIPNPIDLTVSKTLSNSEFKIDIPDEFIVSAGRLIQLKGYDVLIASFAKIKKDNPNLKLVILGEGELLDELKSQAKTLGILDAIIFPGFMKNVYPYFKKATLCVVSSRIEGFPNVLLQMMSQNNKVVSTLCAGGIEDIEGVFTCQPSDEGALTNSMRQCLDTNTDSNRYLFDTFLKSRSIEAFVENINNRLN